MPVLVWSVSRQREKFLYEQSRKFLLSRGTVKGGRRTGDFVVDTKGAGPVEGTA
jgi:hypothetical protein